MRNFVQVGNTITMPAPAVLTGGDVVIVGELHGIAAGDADAGEDFDLVTTGVFELPKVAADAFAVGDAVYWDAANKLVTAEADGNSKIGAAVAEALATSGTVNVKLI